MSAPKPGPMKPGPTKPAATTRPALKDPSSFGRIDADGTVYRTDGGKDVAIGSWHAGSVEEGMALYTKRFRDLYSEVQLLINRLAHHPEAGAATHERLSEIESTLDNAPIIGDMAALRALLAKGHGAADAGTAKAQELKASYAKRKQEIVTQVEALAQKAEWRKTGDKISGLFDEWRSIPRLEGPVEKELWRRMEAARDVFRKRRGQHFSQLDKQRAAAKKIKLDIIERAEALKNSTEWAETSRAYRDLMDEWRAAGRAGKAHDDDLWAKFRAAQDVFFQARAAKDEAIEAQYQENSAKKRALIEEYSKLIDPSAGLDKAKELLHELHEKWEEIGYVASADRKDIEAAIREIEKRVEKAEEREWRRTDPEALARIEQFLNRAKEFAAAAEAEANPKKKAELESQAKQWSEWAEAAKSAIEE
ncbi:MAG: DUF349 domain-containing protein [Corynebacterium sp.]|nr:DUF349 domain-containing protein [Corynebacterium sp.]